MFWVKGHISASLALQGQYAQKALVFPITKPLGASPQLHNTFDVTFARLFRHFSKCQIFWFLHQSEDGQIFLTESIDRNEGKFKTCETKYVN